MTNGNISTIFICSNCNLLTDAINRPISQKYEKVKCNQCNQKINPKKEINGPNGYFIKLDIKSRLKSMLTNQSFRRHLQFFDESCLPPINHYGTIQSGKFFRLAIKMGDLSLTLFADEVNIFGFSSSNLWPLVLSINELSKKI